MNFNFYLKQLFGTSHGLDRQLGYSIQFLELAQAQLGAVKSEPNIPDTLRAYVADFDSRLTHEEYNSDRFSYRLLFKRKLVNRAGQADRVIEFIDPNSELAKQIDKEYWVKKEVERPKFRPKDVVAAVRNAGFSKFRISPDHVDMWRAEDAKNPAKGFGVNVQGVWYWYQAWVDKCIALCESQGTKFRGN